MKREKREMIMLKLLMLNLLIALGLNVSSCSKYNSSGTSGEKSFGALTLTGTAITNNGQAVENADIFAGNINQKIGTTASDGSFKVLVGEDHKEETLGENPNISQFNLYIQKSSAKHPLLDYQLRYQ